MNIKQLKELIKDLSDDVEILMVDIDRNPHYKKVDIKIIDIEFIEQSKCYCSYIGELYRHPDGKIIKALIVN